MISFFMVDRKSDLLLECDFSLFLVEFFVRECVEIKQSCYQLSGFSKKKNGKGEEKENSEDKKHGCYGFPLCGIAQVMIRFAKQ